MNFLPSSLLKRFIPISILFAISNFAIAKQINIVVTVPYIEDLIQNATCSNPDYKISSLIPVGVDPHTFILTPRDRIQLKNADIIIEIGSGLEHWLDKINLEKNQKRLLLTNHITDPHIWQSPALTKEALYSIEHFLISMNLEKKSAIEKCTEDFSKQIDATVLSLKRQIESIPISNRTLATNHDSLGYFAETFGFKIYSILGFSDEDEPSLKQLQNLITILQRKEIKSVFLESTGNTKNIQTIANNSHVEIGGKLYGDSFGEKGSGAETVLGLWKTNVNTLVKALR